MDHLSPELRAVVEAARAPRLTRAEKERFFRRLEEQLEPGVEPSLRRKPERPRFAVARHALAGLCVLAFAIAFQNDGTTVTPPEPPSSVARVDSAETVTIGETLVVAPVPAGEGPRTAEEPALQRPASRARKASPPRAVELGPDAGAFGLAPGPAELEPVAVAVATEEVTFRPRPARTRLLETKQPTSGALRATGSQRVESFRERLIAENQARYQAAIAEHARIASIRRPLSSVGGYAAW